MDNQKSTQIANSDSIDDNECLSPDLIQIDTNDDDELSSNGKNLMPDPYIGEEFLDDGILKAMEQFVYEFTNRYSTSGPPLYMGTLNQALAHSLFDPRNPCPLILLIYHNQSVSTNVFCKQVLCVDKIINYLAENFIVWAWDRTNEINYERLLTMLRAHLGDEVVETVASSPSDRHPMLICLMFDKGHVEIITTIEGSMTSNETLTCLMEARNTFDRRDETPDETALSLRTVSNEGWSISPSVLVPVDRTSEEFKRIANEYIGSVNQVISIDQIENTLWLFQYLNQKKTIDTHFEDDKSEQLLIFPCSQNISQQIFQNGFNDNHKSIQNRKYGYGFYFSSPPVYRQWDTSANSANRNLKTMLVCRVLVGRTCLGNWMMETCPEGYDSTTNGIDTYVVYSNRSILPKYYIKY